jgi:hypothetical protein
MPFWIPTLDGVPIFGLVTKFTPEFREAAVQENSFFGQDGIVALWGGKRGAVFHIEGVFQESSPLAIAADISAINSFAGQGLHQLIDTSGVTWNNILFKGRITPGHCLYQNANGYVRAYSMMLESLLV